MVSCNKNMVSLKRMNSAVERSCEQSQSTQFCCLEPGGVCYVLISVTRCNSCPCIHLVFTNIFQVATVMTVPAHHVWMVDTARQGSVSVQQGTRVCPVRRTSMNVWPHPAQRDTGVTMSQVAIHVNLTPAMLSAVRMVVHVLKGLVIVLQDIQVSKHFHFALKYRKHLINIPTLHIVFHNFCDSCDGWHNIS